MMLTKTQALIRLHQLQDVTERMLSEDRLCSICLTKYPRHSVCSCGQAAMKPSRTARG